MIALVMLLALPIREFPAKKAGDTFAIILTGDGGWRRIDKQLTRDLNGHAISVAGFDMPAWFRRRRTPDESAKALEQIIRDYRAKWHRPRVILIGYSRGADVLPFMASRLADKSDIALIALLGVEPAIDFVRNEPELAVGPEVEKLRGQRILCVYGEKEKSSLCRSLDPALAMPMKMKGAHHFAGNYETIAEAIVRAAQ